MLSDSIPLIVLAALALLLYKAFRSGGERPFADLSEAEADLNRWTNEHRDIHPGDYPTGKRLAERYLNVLLAASDTVPTLKNDPEHLGKIEYAARLAAPKRSGSFHAIA
ncbi:MAG: hypothetical protein KBD19_00910 [Candidatus Moranbacteria bacterium]|nr:hypothetical protein [Candidatus Moranbacteria bacterium]